MRKWSGTHEADTKRDFNREEFMTPQEVSARIHSFVQDNFLYMRPDFELREDDPLLSNGILDSMGVMEMIGFLETELGVTVADDEITEENLGSISAIVGYVMAHPSLKASAT